LDQKERLFRRKASLNLRFYLLEPLLIGLILKKEWRKGRPKLRLCSPFGRSKREAKKLRKEG